MRLVMRKIYKKSRGHLCFLVFYANLFLSSCVGVKCKNLQRFRRLINGNDCKYKRKSSIGHVCFLLYLFKIFHSVQIFLNSAEQTKNHLFFFVNNIRVPTAFFRIYIKYKDMKYIFKFRKYIEYFHEFFAWIYFWHFYTKKWL